MVMFSVVTSSKCLQVILEWLCGFHYFLKFQSELGNRSSWSEPQSHPGLVFAGCIELLHFWLQGNNQSYFGVDRLLMFTCRVFSCVVGRGYLLWPMHSLGKTLLAFALLHSVLQGQTCLLLQVFLDFLLLHSSQMMKRTSFFGVSSRRS